MPRSSNTLDGSSSACLIGRKRQMSEDRSVGNIFKLHASFCMHWIISRVTFCEFPLDSDRI